ALEVPAEPDTSAGIAAFQNETHWYFLGVRRRDGKLQLFLEKSSGKTAETIASTLIEPVENLKLKIAGNDGAYSFAYATKGDHWQWLLRDDDGSILSTEVAGGFVGATLGPYARDERGE
ncbi:MAG TPA: glycoside hydrolase family 43 protein, partial [Pseudoxanthomonas sp.]|nr:glycoside hydrolase family 43 protein [Pseudoxanthomonas sp.]